MTSNYVLLRINASSEYKTFDTSKKLNGNPIILSTITHPAAQSNNLIYNASDLFYSVNVSSNFLATGFIELELECPTFQRVEGMLSTAQYICKGRGHGFNSSIYL